MPILEGIVLWFLVSFVGATAIGRLFNASKPRRPDMLVNRGRHPLLRP